MSRVGSSSPTECDLAERERAVTDRILTSGPSECKGSGVRLPWVLSIAVLLVGPMSVAGGQTTAPAAVSAPLRTHLSAERFQIVTAVRGLPLGVREELQRMFGSFAAAIADPGAPFQATDDVNDPTLPTRRLVVGGCAQDHCLVYYERGGVSRTWQAALFHWTPTETRLEAGGVAPRDLKSVEDVRAALLSGALKPTKAW